MGPCCAQYKCSPKVYSQSLAHIWLMTCPTALASITLKER